MKRQLLLWLLLFRVGYSYAQVNVELYQQFNGRYDFTFVGNTLNENPNGFIIGPNGQPLEDENGNFIYFPCSYLPSSSAALNLNADDVIHKAYLYWAASGTGDFEVSLNGQALIADPDHSYPMSYTTTQNGVPVTRHYFSAFADVTSLVQATGNGNYTFSDLDISEFVNDDLPPAQQLYCQSGANFAGWVIVVIYENSSLPLNQVNLYDGLQNVPTEVNITLNSLNVIDNIGAKIGFVAWEGDANIAAGERLKINGITMGSPINPPTNAFNGTNTVTGQTNMYNMDLDIYSIQNIINIGDATAQIQLQSTQDFVMINAVLTVLNSELPDTTIVAENIVSTCNSRTFTVDYTVSNINSTDPLPAGIPIAIYADGTLIGTTQTVNELPIDGSEDGTITLTLPDNLPTDFELVFAVDDVGDGTGTVLETDETNNTFAIGVSLLVSPPLQKPADITVCFEETGFGIFNFSAYEISLKNTFTDVVTFYLSQTDAEDGINNITNLTNFSATSNPQQIFVRLTDAQGCFSIQSFSLITKDCPDATIVLGAIEKECDSREITGSYTVINSDSFGVLPAGTPIAIYANGILVGTTQTVNEIPIDGSENGTITLTLPNSIPTDFELVFVVDDAGNGTSTVLETDETNNIFVTDVSLLISPTLIQPADLTACFEENGFGIFDFSSYAISLQNEPTDLVTFYLSQTDAEIGVDNITDPANFPATTNPQTIYVRLVDENGCFTIGSFDLITVDCLFPDATIVLGNMAKECNSREITVDYTVNNFNSFDVLPAGTPIAIYADGQFVEFTETITELPIGGSENGTINIMIPDDIPLDFELLFIVDDMGDGTGIVVETDENNNSATTPFELNVSPELQQPEDIIACNEGFGLGTFDFSYYEQQLQVNPGDVITFYNTLQNAQQDVDRIYNTSQFVTLSNPQEIFVRLDDGNCFSTGSFLLSTKNCPPETYNYVTPNGDGKNDTFFVKGLRNIFPNFKMNIYNRWGNLVWTGDHSKDDWNGIANVEKVGPEGTTVPVGTYYFVLELNDPDYPKPIVGWVYVTE